MASLSTLPTEIQLEILTYLDYPSLRRLSSTNYHFNYLPSDDIIENATSITDPEYFLRRKCFPCFVCRRPVRIRPNRSVYHHLMRAARDLRIRDRVDHDNKPTQMTEDMYRS
jgi:hypothetical protein